MRQEDAQSTQLSFRHAVMSCHAANVHASLTTHFQAMVSPFRTRTVLKKKKERKESGGAE